MKRKFEPRGPLDEDGWESGSFKIVLTERGVSKMNGKLTNVPSVSISDKTIIVTDGRIKWEKFDDELRADHFSTADGNFFWFNVYDDNTVKTFEYLSN